MEIYQCIFPEINVNWKCCTKKLNKNNILNVLFPITSSCYLWCHERDELRKETWMNLQMTEDIYDERNLG